MIMAFSFVKKNANFYFFRGKRFFLFSVIGTMCRWVFGTVPVSSANVLHEVRMQRCFIKHTWNICVVDKTMWHPLCHQFHETSVLGVHDAIAGGDGSLMPFLAMSRRHRLIPTEPMWVLLGRQRPASVREALLVDVCNDDGLVRMIYDVAPMSDALEIARYVSREMGGPHVTESMCVFPHGRFVVRLGEVSVGVCRHRSLLLKVRCDTKGVPCGLVRGTYVGVSHQWNVVPAKREGFWILDAMATDLEPILPEGEVGRRYVGYQLPLGPSPRSIPLGPS